MGELATLDWSHPRRAHVEAQEVLARISDPEALLRSARERDPQLSELDRSSEKTTHYKWFVAADPACRFELWLNQYKPATHRRTGHAETAHNHRFWFSSLLLSGAFVHAIFDAATDGSLRLRRTVRLTAGDTYVVDPDEVHALRDLQDETLTLVVQTPAVRSYSDVYEDGRVTRYHDLPSVRRQLNERLATLRTFSAAASRRNH